ncbi:MAG: GNAT family N-acetyltransferase [Lachnospiraceae bacterium]|nr:GNAT family N-acetyltransferase [Lachnospiraceae bacterium]
MVIETKRLMIHTASEDEMRSMLAEQTDEELIKAYGEMLQESLDHPKEWHWYAAWIIELKGGAAVGDLCFKGLNDGGSVEIGYGITEENQGHGYATEAVEAAALWALKQPGVSRVEAETDPENGKSQRVLEKCGFIPSGIIGEEGPRFYKEG